MSGTFDVHSVPQLPSAYVAVLRHWSQRVTKITSGYEFSGIEPHDWSSARGRLWYRGTLHDMSGSDLNVMEPGESCDVTFASSIDFRVLIIDPQYVIGVLEDADLKNFHLRPGGFQESALHTSLFRACTAMEDPAEDDLKHECLVRDVILRAFTRRGETTPLKLCSGDVCAIVRRAREYLHAHACMRVMLDDVASAVRVSKYYLERTFRTELGIPIHKYLQLVKVERGITFIRAGLGIAETAAALGFADQAHMTRVFRSTLGATPSTYRPGKISAGEHVRRPRPPGWLASHGRRRR